MPNEEEDAIWKYAFDLLNKQMIFNDDLYEKKRHVYKNSPSLRMNQDVWSMEERFSFEFVFMWK